jgi:hypothetical protein
MAPSGFQSPVAIAHAAISGAAISTVQAAQGTRQYRGSS